MISLSPRAERKDCYFENKENMSNKTHYMEACMTKGTSMASQFLTVPPGTTNVGT